jgi:hypothetical protein
MDAVTAAPAHQLVGGNHGAAPGQEHRGRACRRAGAIDGFAFPSDPRTAFGLPFREVSYASELGPTRAWFVGDRRGTWVLSVRGYNAPAGRRCACSGWWPTRGSRRWCSVP